MLEGVLFYDVKRLYSSTEGLLREVLFSFTFCFVFLP